MASADVFADAFDRIQGIVHSAVDGLTPEQLSQRVDGKANSIAWLIWHLARVQDDHLADAAGTDQVWTSGWNERFGLPFDDSAIGYGMSFEEVGQVHATSELLVGYYDAVHEQTLGYVKRLADSDLTRIVDDSWDPPVTLGARIVSVISDDLQHAGQASFVRGLIS